MVQQRRVSTGMVAMVVGVENGGQSTAVRLQVLDHGFRSSGIYHGDPRSGVIEKKKDVIVGESPQRGYLHGRSIRIHYDRSGWQFPNAKELIQRSAVPPADFLK
jgi:hypothetical protein